MDKTIGGIILWDIKNVISLFLTKPALNVNLDRAYAANVPKTILIKLAVQVTKILLKYGSTISTPPLAGDFIKTFQPSRLVQNLTKEYKLLCY